MKKNSTKFAVCALLAALLLGGCVYHKPALRGKVVDAETDEPLEGAVVAVIYSRKIFTYCCCIFPHSSVEELSERETLTDMNGMFYIPSYTTVMMPISLGSGMSFSIFKPGYGWRYRVSPAPLSGGGMTESLSKGSGPVLKMPKVKTWEERQEVSIYLFGDGPLLRNALKKEKKWLYKNKGWRR
ncbi:MAG: hypothetical protein DRI57_17305 [Deltaproteobacteria bacterium]|nr:MAG: hypothetical protein DRI57_17305 [Deltaproteobacteria bacterium]